MVLYINKNKVEEVSFAYEKDFEEFIVENQKLLFGSDSIYLNLKKKLRSETLGNSIPDGFLFDFTDKEEPEFYIIEVELAKHSFYDHIFKQVTKFFSFFSAKKKQSLINEIYNYILSNSELQKRFKQYLGNKEIHHFLNELLNDSQNILLLIDNEKIEIDEVMDTYAEWRDKVKYMIIKKYVKNGEQIISADPEFRYIDEHTELRPSEEEDDPTIDENYHLQGKDKIIKEIYEEIKKVATSINSEIIFNPQKYYISIRHTKNYVFLTFRKKFVRCVIMRPFEELQNEIKINKLERLSDKVQGFYGGSCAQLKISSVENVEELRRSFEPILKKH